MSLKFYFLLLFALFNHILSAKHIIGGDISYVCNGINGTKKIANYTFTLKVYRDCYYGILSKFDQAAHIGVYAKSNNNNYRLISSEPINLKEVIKLETVNPCVIIPPDICVDEGLYIFNLDLPIINETYVIAYQRCCRNETISNILNPGDQGAAYTVEISPLAQQVCNSSPVFKNFPPIVICVNARLNFDHSAIDKEGDFITYEFCDPYIAGGKGGSPGNPGSATDCTGVTPDPSMCLPPFSTVQFRAPFYTVFEPLGGLPPVTINTLTGLITGTPNIIGQFVVGVCMKEYRNGQLLSESRRDFQFNVTTCIDLVNAKIASDSVINNKEYILNSCGNNTIDFINESSDEKFINTYDWEFNINGQIQSYNIKNPSVSFPGIGSYLGTLFLNRGSVGCNDTATVRVNVFPDIKADFSFKYDTCIAGPVQFKDLSYSGSNKLTNWNWLFEPQGKSITKDPSFDFRTPGIKPVLLIIKDINGCMDTITKDINYYPVPQLLVIDPSDFVGCNPMEVLFENLSYPIDTTYDIIWDFGDGQTSGKISPTHTFDLPGIYSVNLKVRSPIGCFTEINYPNWIEVKPSPVADFIYKPQDPSSFHKDILITDQSIDAQSLKYIIDNRDILIQRNPKYTFRDTGIHEVKQIVVHASGCQDTLIQFIDVEPKVTYFVPNAFTPNGDGSNELFYGVGYVDGMKNFEMSIWDRWGSLLFKSNDPNEAWNSRINNTGSIVQNGVYVYKISFSTPRDKLVNLKGFVTVVR